jgi:hypothetical protein
MERRRLVWIAPALLLGASGCAVRVRRSGDAGQSGGAAPPSEDVPRIGVEEAYAEVMAGRALLYDVRGEESYQRSRAAGAIFLPLEQIEPDPAAAARALAAGKRPILYCT